MVAPQKEVFTRNLLTSCMLGRVGWLAMFSSSFAAVAKKFGATRRGWLVVAGFGLVSPGAIAQMEVSARQIVFSALTGGDAPAPQSIAVTSDISNQREFTIQIDAAPGQWLSAGPRRAITPARIQLQAHTAGLSSGSYSARVMVQSGATVIPIEVNLSLEDKAPSMDVIPAYVRFQLTESTVSSKQVLYVRNAGGGGSLDFRVSLASNNDWISVSPASGRSEPDRPGLVTVAVDEAKVRAADTAIVQITAGDESRTVPVTVAPPQSGPVLAVNLTGIRLEAGGGGSYSHVRTVPVINLGGGTLHWEAAVISGGEWLQVTPERGTATAEQFGRLLLQAEPSDLSPGVYNALIRVTDQSDGTTPQYVTAALKIGDPDAALSPEPSPAGLFFVGNAGGSEVAPQPILLLAATTAPVAFQASASTADGGDWLRVEPRTGFTSMHDPQALRVIVDPKRLSSGIYTGDVTVAFANRSIRSTNITLVAPGSTEAAKASQRQQQSVSCVPSSLALTHTGTVNSFAIPAGWPTPVVIRLADNCGGAVSEASMVATFSNGDPPLAMRLTNPRLGIYSATWIPRRGHQRVSATARATSPALGTATAVIIGGVEDEAAASMPLPSGVLSMSGPGLGSVIALGAPVQIFGSNLAKSARAAMSMPLPLLLDDTSVVIGGREAPLFFVSESQINAQIPFELAADKEHAVVVMSAGGFTVAEPLVLATTRPILLTVGTRVLAQRADGVMVTPEAPVEPGERITFFLTGMGHTVPAVASGELPAPSVVPVVRIAPRVTIGGVPAVVHSTELAPDAVGVYRMQVTIPSETAPGLATVEVEQNGVNSNSAELPVR